MGSKVEGVLTFAQGKNDVSVKTVVSDSGLKIHILPSNNKGKDT